MTSPQLDRALRSPEEVLQQRIDAAIKALRSGISEASTAFENGYDHSAAIRGHAAMSHALTILNGGQ